MTAGAPRFAVVGCGGVGGGFGAQLARAGYEVGFVARGAHLEALRGSGIAVEAPDGRFALPVRATDRPAEIGPVDIVLFAVKLWDTAEAVEACRPLLGPETAVLCLQNGVDSVPLLAGALGREHVMGGVAEISAMIAAPGRIVRVSPFQRIRFGELDGRPGARSALLAEALAAAGIDHELPPDIVAAIWSKFEFLVGLSALTAVTRCPIGEVRADPGARRLLREVMAEVRAVALARGVALVPDSTDRQMAFVDALPPAVRASMALDLERGRRLELPWLSGAVVRLGEELGVATPANRFVCAALGPHAGGAPASASAAR